LGLGVYDYGARMYDPAKVRWDVTDGKAELYYSSSPYVYASNTPVQAVDPDGNLVIFINGMHSGDGGKAGYWRTYETVRYMSGTNSFMGFSYHTFGSYQRETSAFDRSVMNQLGDHNALYRDGSMGGAAGIMTDFGPGAGNIIASNRINSGYNQGQKDAKTIIENLARDKTTGEIVETIKIITHSMGSAYGKGYVKALQEYIKTLPKEQQYQIKITLVADFEPYQAGSLKANKNIFTEQFTNIGGLADERQEGLNDSNYHENSTQTAHSITTFSEILIVFKRVLINGMAHLGNVQLVKNKKMEINNISKYFLLNFMYVPLSIIYAYSIGEDSNTVIFFIILSLITSLLLYVFVLLVTIMAIKLIKNNSFIPFIIPVLLILPFKYVLKWLDFGGKYGIIFIIIGTLFINIFTCSRLKKIKVTKK